MKRIVLGLLLCASPAFAVPTLVQTQVGPSTGSGTTRSITLGSSCTSGNDEVMLWHNSGTVTISTGTPPAQTGFTWTKVIQDGTGSRNVELWQAHCTGGSSKVITVTLSATLSAGLDGQVIMEWSGLTTTNITTSLASGSGTTISPTITPAAGSTVLFAVAAAGGVPAVPNGTPVAGWTSIAASTNESAGGRGIYAYQVVATTSGSYSPAWTAATGTYNSAIVSYLSPGGTTNHGFTRLLQ